MFLHTHGCCPHPSPTVNSCIAWVEEETACHWFILHPDVTCQKSQAQWVIKVIYFVAHYCLIHMKNKVVWVLKLRTLVNQTWCYMLITPATWEVDMGIFQVQAQLKHILKHSQSSISKYCSSRNKKVDLRNTSESQYFCLHCRKIFQTDIKKICSPERYTW